MTERRNVLFQGKAAAAFKVKDQACRGLGRGCPFLFCQGERAPGPCFVPDEPVCHAVYTAPDPGVRTSIPAAARELCYQREAAEGCCCRCRFTLPRFCTIYFPPRCIQRGGKVQIRSEGRVQQPHPKRGRKVWRGPSPSLPSPRLRDWALPPATANKAES